MGCYTSINSSINICLIPITYVKLMPTDLIYGRQRT